MIYNFYVSTICGPFEGGPWANVSNAFLHDTALLGFSGYFLQVKKKIGLKLGIGKCEKAKVFL